ncbi:MAG: hypothetical protein ACK4RK_10060 [Gemmataceae bacterium]
MRAAYTNRRGMSPWMLFALLGGTVLFGGIGTVATLAAFGVIELPFLNQQARASRPQSGVPVVMSSRPIPAYTQISREHFLNPRTGDPVLAYLSEEIIAEKGIIRDIGQLQGRVLKKDKAPGYVFREEDFFPEGTRPGLVAGIPPGMRAFVLEVQGSNLRGIHSLKAGDHFDIVGTLPVDFEKMLPRHLANKMSPELLASLSNRSGLPKRASVKVLVQDGVVVLPLATREVPDATKPIPKDGTLTRRPVQEITIAVKDHEVPQLTEALAIDAELICVPRSGHPDDPGSTSRTPDAIATPGLRVMDVISGGKRETLIFPEQGEGPLQPPPLAPAADDSAKTATITMK